MINYKVATAIALTFTVIGYNLKQDAEIFEPKSEEITVFDLVKSEQRVNSSDLTIRKPAKIELQIDSTDEKSISNNMAQLAKIDDTNDWLTQIRTSSNVASNERLVKIQNFMFEDEYLSTLSHQIDCGVSVCGIILTDLVSEKAALSAADSLKNDIVGEFIFHNIESRGDGLFDMRIMLPTNKESNGLELAIRNTMAML